MRSFVASATSRTAPGDVLACLADPAACADWAPLPCAVDRLDTERFWAGSTGRVVGELAGQEVAFGVFVRESSERRFAILADGPFAIDVAYTFADDGRGGTLIELEARIGRPQGLAGRAMAAAAGAVLAGGLLDRALARLVRAAERSTLALVAPGEPFARGTGTRELALAA